MIQSCLLNKIAHEVILLVKNAILLKHFIKLDKSGDKSQFFFFLAVRIYPFIVTKPIMNRRVYITFSL